MPTGYTAALYDGKDVTFRDFALGAARGVGALIHMRDDGADAEIRHDTPSTYHAESLLKARRRRRELLDMTAEQIKAAAEADHQRELNAWRERRDARAERKARYMAMLRQVEEWTPPTDEHAPFKAFMVEQLTGSIDFDCSTRYDDPPHLISPEAWYDRTLERVEHEIERAEKNDREERERVTARNRWIDALVESLPELPGKTHARR